MIKYELNENTYYLSFHVVYSWSNALEKQIYSPNATLERIKVKNSLAKYST